MWECARGIFHVKPRRRGLLMFPKECPSKPQLLAKAVNSQNCPQQSEKEQHKSLNQNKIGAPVEKIALPQDNACMRGEPEAEVCSGSTPVRLHCGCFGSDFANGEPEAEASPGQDSHGGCFHGTEQREGASTGAAVQVADPEEDTPEKLVITEVQLQQRFLSVLAEAAQDGRLEAALSEQYVMLEETEALKNEDSDVAKPMQDNDVDPPIDVERPMPAEDNDVDTPIHVERPMPAEDNDVVTPIHVERPMPAEDKKVEEPIPAEAQPVVMRSRTEKPMQTGPERQEVARVDFGRRDTAPVNSLGCSCQEPPVIEYALEQLTNPRVWQKLGIEPSARERSLNDTTFLELFGMDKQAFAKLPKWKRDNLKKNVGLF